MVDKVSGALMKQLAAGDKPKSISSPNLDMSVGRKTIDDIGGENDDEDAEEGEGMGGVKLPDPMALFGGANASVEDGATSAIGSTVCASANYKIYHSYHVSFIRATNLASRIVVRGWICFCRFFTLLRLFCSLFIC